MKKQVTQNDLEKMRCSLMMYYLLLVIEIIFRQRTLKIK